jgi:hypothetical protein
VSKCLACPSDTVSLARRTRRGATTKMSLVDDTTAACRSPPLDERYERGLGNWFPGEERGEGGGGREAEAAKDTGTG